MRIVNDLVESPSAAYARRRDCGADGRLVADLAEEVFGHDEIRVSHEQNLILPHVAQGRYDPQVYDGTARQQDLATANIGLISVTSLPAPGMDYCDAGEQPARSRLRRRFPKRFSTNPAKARSTRSVRTEDQDFRLHQCLRPPPCRPYRHFGRR